MINIVGDSHTHEFLRYSNQFKVFFIGSRTAHQIRNHSDIILPLLPEMKSNKTIFFLGEIDCRLHIYNKAMENHTPLLAGVEITVFRYLEYLKKLKEQYSLSLSVMSIVPPGSETNIYNLKHYADIETKKFITMAFNLALDHYCSQYGLGYINIYKMLVDENNDRLKNAIKDDCHCNYSEKIVAEIISHA